MTFDNSRYNLLSEAMYLGTKDLILEYITFDRTERNFTCAKPCHGFPHIAYLAKAGKEVAMRRIACALTVALITVIISGFGCNNERGASGSDGGGTCSTPIGISVSTASGGFEIYQGGTLIGSSNRSGLINGLCGNSGTSIRVMVHSRATFISRTVNGSYPLIFYQEGGSVLPVRTGLFTTTGPGMVLITVP